MTYIPTITSRKRLPDWNTRWLTYYQFVKRNYRGLEWGEFDCTTWAGGTIEAVTGFDPHSEVRGLYNTPEQGADILAEMGVVALGDFLIQRGYYEIPVVEAQLCDILEIPTDPRAASQLPEVFAWSLAVATPPYAIGVGLSGLVKGPMLEARRAFRVGADLTRRPLIDG